MEKLLHLEETGSHVFHGSPHGGILSFEPRQSTHLSKPDGLPAVSATPHADLATFRALVNTANIPFKHASRFGFDENNEKEFMISSKEALQEVEGKKGFVYVFDRKDFTPYNRGTNPAKSDAMEWRAYKNVEPLDVIEVSSNDLPSRNKIQIMK